MIFCHVGPPWALFRGPRGPHNGPKQHQKWPFMTKTGHSWPQMTLHDPKWPQNTSHGYATWYCVMLDHPGAFSEATGATLASEKAPGWPHMAYNHVLCPCKMFQGHFGSCRDIFGQEGIFWVMKFLHCRAILGHEWPFMVMNGHFWSRRAIMVLFWAIFRLASGVLSNIDHQTKNPNIDQISTTQHFIDQISTAKFP